MTQRIQQPGSEQQSSGAAPYRDLPAVTNQPWPASAKRGGGERDENNRDDSFGADGRVDATTGGPTPQPSVEKASTARDHRVPHADKALQEDVTLRLRADQQIDSRDLTAVVSDGVVTLS